jgi:sulfur relay (sulfurtransferase) DsrC/TusE family protein
MLNDKKKIAIRCAFEDLVGAYQAYEQNDIDVHYWKDHWNTIQYLIQYFPEFNFKLPKNLTYKE